MRLLDKTNTSDYKQLGDVTDKFMAALSQRKELMNLFTFYTAGYPQYELIFNDDVAMQKGVSIGKALDNLNILIGSTYEQGFILFNQFYKVYVQALPEFRRLPEDLDNLFVKNETGGMVPHSSFMKIERKLGLNEITRYNLYPSAAIQGAPASGYSTGQAIKAIQEVAKTLPHGYGVGWEGLSYDEAKKGNEAGDVFLIVVVFVYLVLVGQYESFILPLVVILSLPVGLFGSFLLLKAMGLANDVYAQIGLVMLVGLLGKNAILEVVLERLLGAGAMATNGTTRSPHPSAASGPDRFKHSGHRRLVRRDGVAEEIPAAVVRNQPAAGERYAGPELVTGQRAEPIRSAAGVHQRGFVNASRRVVGAALMIAEEDVVLEHVPRASAPVVGHPSIDVEDVVHKVRVVGVATPVGIEQQREVLLRSHVDDIVVDQRVPGAPGEMEDGRAVLMPSFWLML